MPENWWGEDKPGLTVKELVEILKSLDQSLPVWRVCEGQYAMMEAEQIYVREAKGKSPRAVLFEG